MRFEVLTEKYVFRFCRKIRFAVLSGKICFCGFGKKNVFCYFGGKIRFVVWTKNVFLAVLAEKCFCCGFERKNMSKLEYNIFFRIRVNSSFVQTRPMK